MSFRLNPWTGELDCVDMRNGIIVFPKTSGKGIQVDYAAPGFPFRDLIGEAVVRTTPGGTDPTFAVFRDTLKAYSFSNAVTQEIFSNYHVGHDYAAGTDTFLHVHWAQNVVDSGGAAGVPGAVKIFFDVSYAKGHNQAAYPAIITTSITQTASAVQYQHMLAEVQLTAASPSAAQFDSDILEPDGIIMVRTYRDPTDAADTLNQVPFLFYVDIHYQSTNIGTKQKAPNFYA